MSIAVPDWARAAWSTNRRVAALVAGVLAVHAAMLMNAAVRHSPTLDEPAHLVAGVSHWLLGRMEIYSVNPPLVRLVAALPVVLHGCETDWSGYSSRPGSRPEFGMGERFVAINRPHARRLFTIARWACVPFSLIGGLGCFLWARELWGRTGAGIIALILWCFEPNVLAHAELFTPDCAASSLGVWAGYTFWKWLKQPSWTWALLAGLALGLAELAKMSWLILFGLWPLLWLMWRLIEWWSHGARLAWQDFCRQATQLGLVLTCAVYLINLGYAFDGVGTRLGQFVFVSHSLNGKKPGEPGNRFVGTWLADVPVPLPKQYLVGFDLQRKDLERFPLPSYLRGEWKNGGWWYYYVYGLLVKTPHGVQLLLATLVVAVLATHVRRRLYPPPEWDVHALTTPNPLAAPFADLAVLLAPAVLLLVVVSSQLAFNHNLRYVLPGFGFAFVFGGGAWLLWEKGGFGRFWTALCLGWTILASALNHPHHLAYFNELAGGPDQGHRHLLHSNLDWSQDLYFLPPSTPEAPLHLIYYGLCQPADLGVTAEVFHMGIGRGNDFSDRLYEFIRARKQPVRFAVSKYYWDEFEKAVASFGGSILNTSLAGKSIVLCEVSRS